jgi:hypothetical protein
MEDRDLHTENYKMLLREIKEVANKWKEIPCSGIRRLNMVKISMLPRVIYRLSASLPKSQLLFFFYRNGKINPQIIMEIQGILLYFYP